MAVAAPVGSLQRCPVASGGGINWGALAAAGLVPLIVSLVNERDETGHWKLLAETGGQDMGGLDETRREECT